MHNVVTQVIVCAYIKPNLLLTQKSLMDKPVRTPWWIAFQKQVWNANTIAYVSKMAYASPKIIAYAKLLWWYYPHPLASKVSLR